MATWVTLNLFIRIARSFKCSFDSVSVFLDHLFEDYFTRFRAPYIIVIK